MIKVVGDKLLLKVIEEKEKITDSGIVMTTKFKLYSQGNIIVLGSDCKVEKTASLVYFVCDAGIDIGNGLVVISEKDVICYEC